MQDKTSMLAALEAGRDQHISLLQSFVKAASPNPPGETTAAAKVLTDFLDSRGIPYEIIDPDPQGGRPNIVAEFHGRAGDGPRLVLNGHIDVFPVGDDTSGWARDPWSGDIDGDRIHGRGVVDMKSGTASLVIAFAYLYERRDLLRGSVALCAVSDEETGGKWGTKYLIHDNRNRWGGDVMLSSEPAACNTVRFAEKGTLRMTCTVETMGAHGAYLNLSKGAVRTSAALINDIVEAVEAMPVNLPKALARHAAKPEVQKAIDEAMGPGTSTIILRPTVNVGTIAGGLKVNMIPSACSFALDIRLPTGLTREQVLSLLEGSIIPRYAPQAARISLSVHEAASNPASYSSLDHPMIELLAENAKALRPSEPKPVATPSMGATDCKHYRYAYIPAFVYGCSPLSMASVNESASISEFLHVTKVHAATAWDYLTDPMKW